MQFRWNSEFFVIEHIDGRSFYTWAGELEGRRCMKLQLRSLMHAHTCAPSFKLSNCEYFSQIEPSSFVKLFRLETVQTHIISATPRGNFISYFLTPFISFRFLARYFLAAKIYCWQYCCNLESNLLLGRACSQCKQDKTRLL